LQNFSFWVTVYPLQPNLWLWWSFDQFSSM